MRGLRSPRAALAAAICIALGGVAFTATGAQAFCCVQPYGTNDYGGFRNILPAGENGLVNSAEFGAYKFFGVYPPHFNDQNPPYLNLLYGYSGLTTSQVPNYFKDATFGVPSGQVASEYSPGGRTDLTIERDSSWGVPHIYASTRSGLMYGAGYAAAQDRLFLMDAMRHLGRGQLSAFAGGTSSNVALDKMIWSTSPYTEADLSNEIANLNGLYGSEGAQIRQDLSDFVSGINQYISEARNDNSKLPVEYSALFLPGPSNFTANDVAAVGVVIGQVFGNGGGDQLKMAQLLQGFQSQFGSSSGLGGWNDFRALNDPEAPTTVLATQFPYLIPPSSPAAGSEALPDSGSVAYQNVVTGCSGGGCSASAARAGVRRAASGRRPIRVPSRYRGRARLLRRIHTFDLSGLLRPNSMSNAMLVSGGHTASGHPIAVMGPQTGYFSPQLLMEEDLHAPGIDARGAAFPGLNGYVLIGHGQDYAWSATSAGQTITDTFEVPLCNPSGGTVTTSSNYYLYGGSCLAMDVLSHTNSWQATFGGSSSSGSVTLTSYRTKLGIVQARATINGQPVAYTILRSTYMHDIDSARGFAKFNEPSAVYSPQTFQQAASEIGATFNWFYSDNQHIAYFNSGNNPVRASGTDPSLPISGQYPWQNFNPYPVNTASYTSFSSHPQVIDQDYLVSWNNKQAPQYGSSDTAQDSSLYRSLLLEDRVKSLISGGTALQQPDMISAMEDAATVDLRGKYVLPWALQVIGTPSDPTLANAVSELQTWVNHGAHRIDPNRTGTYNDSDAIRIMDAWWPGLIQSVFSSTLGSSLYSQLTSTLQLDDAPHNHHGSAYQSGFYGYVQKDLRAALGQSVPGWSRTYCGGGSLSACQSALLSSLNTAVGTPATTVYTDPKCANGNQKCYDQINPVSFGAIGEPSWPWFNRPTFQQDTEVQGHR
jgi:acyl-homoserine lactone acylase PvdQ